MKRKPITALMLILLILSLAAIPAGAVDMVEPVGTVYAPKVTTPPTLDGVISEGEWNANAAFVINDWNMKAVVASGFIEVTEGWSSTFHLAWDSEYLYIAAETVDPTSAQESTEKRATTTVCILISDRRSARERWSQRSASFSVSTMTGTEIRQKSLCASPTARNQT